MKISFHFFRAVNENIRKVLDKSTERTMFEENQQIKKIIESQTMKNAKD